MHIDLTNKVAIITGGSSGLGVAVAMEMAKAGAKLTLLSRNIEALDRAKHEIANATRGEVAIIACDLSRRGSAEEGVNHTVKQYGRVDILVNCAGATKRGDFFGLTDQDWDEGYALKLHGAVRMCRAAWPHLVNTKGVIINIAGVSMNTPTKDFTIGASVNSALVTFSKALADLGIDDDVRVNVINPGYIASPRLNRRIEALEKTTGRDRTEIHQDLLAVYGIPRFGEPCEVGHLAVYLASDQATYMQGIAVNIDGGASRGQ